MGTQLKQNFLLLTGPGLVLKGAMIANYSIFEKSPSVIGIDDDALYCVTDDTACCGIPPSTSSGGSGNGRGHWYYPGDSGLLSSTEAPSTYRYYTSWLSGAVLMHYRGDGSSEDLAGHFRCDIQDSTGTTHQLYTCLYDSTSATDCEFPVFTKHTDKLNYAHIIVHV